MRRQSLIAVGLAVLLLAAGCSAGTGSSGAASDADGRTIHVSGSGSAEAEPNQAVLSVGVVATGDDAATARQRLAENVSRMRTALDAAGVDDDQITTQRYDIDRDYRRPPREGEDPEMHYRAVHAFEITLNQTDRVGTVIDTAVENGATEVNNIEFTLSTDRRRELEQSARRAAMADARATAEGLAGSANLTVTGVRTVRAGDGSPRPVEDYAAAATATPRLGAPSDIESGPVTVVVTVQVVYDAEQTGDA
jgi:uncharacterized protein YggE